MFLSRTIKALAVLAGFYSFTAHAGTQLHFKTQAVDTTVDSAMTAYRTTAPTDYHIIQFANTITPQDRQELIQSGVEIISYIPDDAYIVKMDLATQEEMQSRDGLQAVLPYAPAFKVSPAFGVIDHIRAEVVEKISIKTFSAEATQKLAKVIGGMGDLRYAKGKYIGVVAPLSAVDAIKNLNGVEWIEPYPELKFMNFEVSADLIEATSRKTVNDLDGYESGTKIMNFEAAWNRGYTGRGQLVGFSDTGLDSGNTASIHRDFQGQVQKGYAYGLLSFSWNDPMGHGTHVAGSIASNGAASNGTLRGGAYEAKLIAGGMWSQLLNNMIPPQDIATMFQDAYNDGARVHTNSWGSPQNLGAYDNFAVTVDQFMWDHPDMLLMFAAGNSGTDANNNGRVDEDSIGTPATAKNVLSVGASENLVSDGGIQRPIGQLKKQDGSPLFSAEPIASDFLSNNENGIAAFSSRGPTDDGRTKPDVVAPGANILSVRSQVEGANELWGALNQDYVWSGGTSMSTPLVAGAAAVVRQYLIENKQISNPSAALVKAMLMHTSTDLYPGQFGKNGKATGQEMLATRPNPHQGFGRVNMDAVTGYNGVIFTGSIGVGAPATAKLSGGQTQDYKITMVYTDAPGAASSGRALVNNLDVEVYEDGQLIGQSRSSLNNFEYIEVAGVTGELEVRVIGSNIPTPATDGGQPFALLVSPL